MPETNNPFDVRVVNSLERPTINDFNLAQAASRTTAQALAQATLDMVPFALSGNRAGFVGNGFRVTKVSGMTVQIRPGLGFGYDAISGSNELNQGGVTGVDVFNTVDAYPMVLTAARNITVNAAPPAGFMRRDIIAVQDADESSGVFSDSISSDVFNPITQTFTPQLKNKTFGWSLNNATIDTLPTGGSTSATARIVYIPGTDQAYAAPDDLLNYLLPTVPNNYTVLAVINVVTGTTAIDDDLICDYRPIFFPTRSIALPISFIGGASIGVPGDRLEQYNTPVVPYVNEIPIITKSGNGTSNRYLITVPGVRNVRTITGVFNAGGNVFDGNPVNKSFANLVTTTAAVAATSPDQPRLNAADVAALNNPLLSAGYRPLAIGQPYSRVEIALGVVDISLPGMNYQAVAFDSDNTSSRTISGALTLSY